MKALGFWPRYAIAWPLVFVGMVLATLSGWFIVSGAWLMDRDDVVEAYKDYRRRQ